MDFNIDNHIKKIIFNGNNSLKDIAIQRIFRTMYNDVKYYASNDNYIEPDDNKKELVKVKDKEKLYANRELINNGRCSQILNLPKKIGYCIIKQIINTFNFKFMYEYHTIYFMNRSEIFNQHFNKYTIFFINHICPYIESVDFCDKLLYSTVYENPYGSGFMIIKLYSKAIEMTVNLINGQKMKFDNFYHPTSNHVLLYLYNEDENILYIEAEPVGGGEKTYKTIITKDNIYGAFSYINAIDDRNYNDMVIKSWLNN